MMKPRADVSGPEAGPDWHDEAALLGQLATLNTRISRYIVQALDADAGRSDPVTPVEEAALGRALVKLGELLHDRSGR
jgi:hypothetical protein